MDSSDIEPRQAAQPMASETTSRGKKRSGFPGKGPVSERKTEANRRNALRSTGPRTPQGKAHSRKNALKHGLFANDLFTDFMVRENPEDFRDLVDQLRQQYQPVGVAEDLQVERIAVCWWRLSRAWRYENAAIVAAGAEVATRIERPSTIREMMISDHQNLALLLQSAQNEINSTGVISKELKEKIFATSPRLREFWPCLEELTTRLGAEQMGVPLPLLKEVLRDGSERAASLARTIALAVIQAVTKSLESVAESQFDSAMNIAFDRHAIPNDIAMGRMLRYESAIERDLNRACDRLERLQRQRKGEAVPPPLSVRLTR